MARERCVLPVRCKECGSVFDLWYDLQAREQLRRGIVSRGQTALALQERAMRLLERQSLCWECRNNLMKMPEEVEEYDLTFEFD